MKSTAYAAVLALALALPGMAVAQNESKPEAAPPPAGKAAPDPKAFDRDMAAMNEKMQEMHALMDKIAQATDPAERDKLLRQHWDLMKDAMGRMHGMWGRGMMGSGTAPEGARQGPMPGWGRGHGPMMGWGGMHGYYSKLTPEQMRRRQYMADSYMGMQQMMMDHMMWHQHWMMGPRGGR
ncbi:MAG TPA: hypothetical protein VHA15_08665 [Burkholderiales bacterium]|nr:hypothetical protein [Burkholderiales bacterium]